MNNNTTLRLVGYNKLKLVRKYTRHEKGIFESRTSMLAILPFIFVAYLFSIEPQQTIISPLARAQEAPVITRIPTPTIIVEPTEPQVKITTENTHIKEYIKSVFKEDSDKAFKLLACENKSLDPDIVNTAGNKPAGSRDTGVFQINEYWQKVQFKFLKNYKINIEIAHQLFIENGKSFKMWTCGRKLGI